MPLSIPLIMKRVREITPLLPSELTTSLIDSGKLWAVCSTNAIKYLYILQLLGQRM